MALKPALPSVLTKPCKVEKGAVLVPEHDAGETMLGRTCQFFRGGDERWGKEMQRPLSDPSKNNI